MDLAIFAYILAIKKKYIVNESNERVVVQLDIKTFEKLERLLKDYVIGVSINENDRTERLKLKEAKIQYKKMRESVS